MGPMTRITFEAQHTRLAPVRFINGRSDGPDQSSVHLADVARPRAATADAMKLWRSGRLRPTASGGKPDEGQASAEPL